MFEIPVTDLAADLGNPMGASMVMAGAYVGLTGLVGFDSLLEGMRESVPPYRRQHVAKNEEAIHAGWEAVAEQRLSAPAWLGASEEVPA